MNTLSKHDVNRLTMSKLLNLLPCEVTDDGKPVAVILPYHDVNKLSPSPEANHDVNRVRLAKDSVLVSFPKSRQLRR